MFGECAARLNQLDSDHAASLPVDGLEDLAHPAAPQRTHNPKPIDDQLAPGSGTGRPKQITVQSCNRSVKRIDRLFSCAHQSQQFSKEFRIPFTQFPRNVLSLVRRGPHRGFEQRR
jgi:hypothetical protein